MNGIIKVIVSFLLKGKEVAIERYRSRVPVDEDKHTRVFEFKKHLTEFLGWKEQAWWFLAQALIVHGQMRELCYSNRWQVTTRTAKFNI